MTNTDPQRDFATQIVKQLRDAGHVAYWAGGCVRDQLLGCKPKDYDVATSARPDEVRQLFGRRRSLPIGVAFGVITVLGSKTEGQVEVATFRQDLGYSDGRRPDDVAFSSPEEDAQRRDFTINGMFYDPDKQQVIDYVGGQVDLRDRLVRAIGDPHQRISEDKLRMLRAIRFASTFEFELEDTTLRAVQDMAQEIVVVSAERIGAEMRRMLVAPTRNRAVQLLRESKLLDVLLPEVASLAHYEHGTEDWAETLRVLQTLTDPSLALALAALLHRAGGNELAERIGTDWRLTNKETQHTLWLLEHAAQVRSAVQTPWPQLQRLLICPGADELVALAAATTSDSHPGVVHCRRKLALPPEQLNPAPLVSGDDLIAHGVAPGKQFRLLLDHVRDAQLEAKIATSAEALALVDRLLK